MNYYHTLIHEPMVVLEITKDYVKFELGGVVDTMPRSMFDDFVRRNVITKTK